MTSIELEHLFGVGAHRRVTGQAISHFVGFFGEKGTDHVYFRKNRGLSCIYSISTETGNRLLEALHDCIIDFIGVDDSIVSHLKINPYQESRISLEVFYVLSRNRNH